MELPLIIHHVNATVPLEVYKPKDGEPLDANHHLITAPEDLEKLPMPILAQLYNQANPGMCVTNFKPGTVIRYCMASLTKLSEVKAAAPPATSKDANTEPTPAGTSPQEGTVPESKEPKVRSPRKRDIPDKYRKGKVENTARAGSLRDEAYKTALEAPDKLTPKLKGIVSWMVRANILERES